MQLLSVDNLSMSPRHASADCCDDSPGENAPLESFLIHSQSEIQGSRCARGRDADIVAPGATAMVDPVACVGFVDVRLRGHFACTVEYLVNVRPIICGLRGERYAAEHGYSRSSVAGCKESSQISSGQV
jgi:hypothetical protein